MKKIFNGAVFVLFIVTFLIFSAQTSFAGSSILGIPEDNPQGIAIDTDGNIYTANIGSNTVSKITPEGVSTILGTTGDYPYSITIDVDGNIYTANETSNNVSKITQEGVSTIIGTTGSHPKDIILDAEGNIYTANSYSDNVSKITPVGVSTILGTTGDYPYSITIDAEGNIYTANLISDNVSKITPAGVSTILGATGNGPHGIAIDADGNIYTANNDDNTVSKITPEGISTILGTVIDYGPRVILADTSGNVYVSTDTGLINLITPEGTFHVFERLGYLYTQDMIIDTEGDIYVSVHDSSMVQNKYVLKITSDSFFTSTYILSSSEDYYIDYDVNTIEYVPSDTLKADFLSYLTKNNEAQVWDTDGISDTVQEGDTLVVTAEDGVATTTYTVGVLTSTDATISSEVYTITIDGNQGTITNVPFSTSQADFLANLVMGNESQFWDYGEEEGNVSDPVQTGDTLIVWPDAGDAITYTITVNTPEPNIFWYKTGINDNWNTLSGNWWTNEAHTIPASLLPDESSVVKTLGTIGPSANTDTWTEPYSIDATATGIYMDGSSNILAEMFGNVTFNSSVQNYSNITGNAIFYNSTQNNGIITGNAIFYNNSIFLSGSVSGNATFNDTSALHNNGEVDGLATFNDNSTNGSSSTVNGDAIFNNESINMGPVLGNATFNDESYNINTVSGNAIFNDTTFNQGTIEGYACFRDESYNDGDVGGLLCSPTITTSLATLVSQTSAILNGEITDDGGEDTSERGFEYGTTISYGTEVSGEGEYSTGTYLLEVTGLTCGTTYHYRAYTINDFDTSYGDDITFTTSSCSNGSSSGSGPSRPKTPTTLVTCAPGQKYNTLTGLPCTTFTPSAGSGQATPTTCAITLTLRQGNKGEQVKCLQTKLNITSDGMFGSMTKAAVILFQKAHSLTPDGIVGPKTRAEL